MARHTFEDLLKMDSLVIPGTWAAEAMGMDATRLLGYAREKPEMLHFPFQLSGNRMKIPRIPFLRFWGVTDEQIAKKSLR